LTQETIDLAVAGKPIEAQFHGACQMEPVSELPPHGARVCSSGDGADFVLTNHGSFARLEMDRNSERDAARRLPWPSVQGDSGFYHALHNV
jgi:hypothetical protein